MTALPREARSTNQVGCSSPRIPARPPGSGKFHASIEEITRSMLACGGRTQVGAQMPRAGWAGYSYFRCSSSTRDVHDRQIYVLEQTTSLSLSMRPYHSALYVAGGACPSPRPVRG